MALDADFETVFRSQFPRLVALGLAMTGDREVATDLAQEWRGPRPLGGDLADGIARGLGATGDDQSVDRQPSAPRQVEHRALARLKALPLSLGTPPSRGLLYELVRERNLEITFLEPGRGLGVHVRVGTDGLDTPSDLVGPDHARESANRLS